jgi:hypothetical protein
VRLRAPRRELDLLAARVRPRVRDVLRHGRREQEAVVGDERDLRAQLDQVQLAQVGAVEEDRALTRVIEAREERHQGRLP